MYLDHATLIVSDVTKAVAYFRDVLGLPVHGDGDGDGYAEVDLGTLVCGLMSDAMVPVEPAAGVILQVRVDDVPGTFRTVQQRGATVLLEPTTTDWGTESAMVAGPDGIVVELYREVPA
jgi:catechol 2,3-dioxygenase-like lactoylglutathione lyase family enzyme